MDKLRKVGLTALAGTFAMGSVQALEMSASGSAGFTFSSSDDDEVQGERFSFGDSITLSGSGETDMGWTVTASYELDDGNTPYDDQTVSIDTGNGTFFVQTNADKGGLEADIDAKLTQGTFTSKKETCEVLSEKCFDRFEPMPENILKSVQNVENIIPSWQWGGEGTRDVLSQRDFLEKNGYEYDGESWKKRCR